MRTRRPAQDELTIEGKVARRQERKAHLLPDGGQHLRALLAPEQAGHDKARSAAGGG